MKRTITITLVVKGTKADLDRYEEAVENALDGGIIQDGIQGVLEMMDGGDDADVENIESTSARAS